MTFEVMLVVLLSALLHAGWNALVRSSADKFASTLAVVLGAGLLAVPLLIALPLPAAPSWPYAVASGLIHVVYFTLVAWSYRHADLSFAYPVMRGSAPVLTALAAALLLQESPSAAGWTGIALICGGVLAMAWQAWQGDHGHGHAPLHSLRVALANAGVIALYTVVDGQGARLSGHAVSYTGWVFVLTALGMLAAARLRAGHSLAAQLGGNWRTAALGGGGTLTAYALVLWAMGHAPIASVAALRESAIVFAALIGVLFLRERIGRARLLSIALVCAGAVAIKLA